MIEKIEKKEEIYNGVPVSFQLEICARNLLSTINRNESPVPVDENETENKIRHELMELEVLLDWMKRNKFGLPFPTMMEKITEELSMAYCVCKGKKMLKLRTMWMFGRVIRKMREA